MTVDILTRCVCFMCIFMPLLYGFNLDMKDSLVLSGPANSYFGYSVAIVSNKWILVGSPRANDTNMPGVIEPGGVHKCEVTKTTSSPCQQLNIDSSVSVEKLSPFNGITPWVTHGRRGQWLGGSMAVPTAGTGKGIIVCAPRWYNRQYATDYAMNGLCYELPLSLSTDNPRTLVPFGGGAKHTITTSWGVPKYNFGMAGMGIDAHYTQGDSNLLLGAPGVKDWTGGFIDVTGTTGKFMGSEINNVNATQSELIGYSVTSGSYFGDGVTYFVLGVPRANLTGKVIFFDSRATDYRLENTFMELYGLEKSTESIPMNAYFGGTLCTIDVNNDGIDDLLVGAPLYSDVSNVNVDDFIDMGSVFLYLGTREKAFGFKTPAKIFSGSRSAFARFGTAIGNLGDVNKDDYNDVAIGAPYEDELNGCVYVYNGYKDGLWSKYSQRISAKQFDPAPKGFGIAISPAADLNNDDIKDTVIGAYLSDHVIVIHGQPVINMQAEMIIKDSAGQHRTLIDKQRGDTSVQMCFKYVEKERLCEYVVLNTTISLDTEKGELGRLVFNKTNLPELHTQVKIFRGSNKCTKGGLISVKNTYDLISRIVVMAEYQVHDISCSNTEITPTINKFDGNNPGDPVLMMKKTLHFMNQCPDNNCQTDLHVAARTEFAGINGFFVIGESSLKININITKDGHPSYGSVFQMTFPKYLLYRNMKQIAGETQVSCSIESTDEQLHSDTTADVETETGTLVKEAGESMMSCSFGNPVVNDNGVEFSVDMQVPAQVTVPIFEFRLRVSSQSNETAPADNDKLLTVNLRNYVNAAVSGVSSPVTMFIRNTMPDSTVSHVYELSNNGPSILPSAVLGFHYPQKQHGTTTDVYLNATKIRCPYPCSVTCSIQNPVKAPPVYEYFNGKLITGNVNMTDEYTSKDSIDCSKVSCSLYECGLKNLLAHTSVVVELELVVNKNVGGNAKSSVSVDLVSRASVQLVRDGIIADKTQFEEKLTTRLLPSEPPKAQVQWWIIIVSIICGILLICIIVFILYKCGFFKRKTRDDFEKMKQKDTGNDTSNDTGKDNASFTDSEGGIIDKEEPPAKA